MQTKAGTKAALDGLKMANSPVEMARIAKLAEKNGNKTRAILKVLGRGAIALTLAAFDLALWIFWALADGVRLRLVDEGGGRAHHASALRAQESASACDKASSARLAMAAEQG